VDFATPAGYRDQLAAGSYRDAWTWVVEASGAIRALALWWGPADHDHPYSLDGLYHAGDGDPVPDWTALIRVALERRPPGVDPPEYHVFLDVDWSDDPQTVIDLRRRSQAAAAAGLTETTDRLRYEWRREAGLPPRSARLRFEPADDDAFAAALARVDAREDVEMYASMPGDRDWWRLAYAGDALVGLAMPSANDAGPVVGYLGVLPEHRGRGYVDDLLAEITHRLAAIGAERVRADTDAGNVPMIRSFERLGYRRFAIRRVLRAPTACARASPAA
jgi:RimJ/RimL family protein N-acetyltransferase